MRFKDNNSAGAANSEKPSTLAFDQIQATCTAFLAQCRTSSAPAIPELVRQMEPQGQPALLRNLLHIDLRNRRSRGDAPQTEDYIREMPEHSAVIRGVFYETVSIAQPQDAVFDSTQMADRPITIEEMPVGDLLGEYRLLRKLGEGGMGAVFEAVHLQRGHHVALKTLPAVDGDSLHFFKREFRRMAEINHPHLIGLHSLESDGGFWFLTMDLIHGTDFRSHVRPNEKLDEPRLRSSLAQLTSAVLSLHGNQIIHRDLKPSNVMVTDEGRVVVLDFGLAFEQEHSGDASLHRVAGTPAYMAPEQASGASVDGAADWYAVGVMLYEAICGQLPFRGDSAVRLLTRKMRNDPPQMPSVPGAPADLVELAMRLLNRNPQDRPDPLELAGKVSKSLTPQSSNIGRSGAVLVGRNRHLSQLRALYDQAKTDEVPQVAFVRGRSGEGKTSLVDHFLKELAEQDESLVVLSGRCYDRESVPFKALDSLIDALAGYLSKLPEAQSASMVPADAVFLASVFPVLSRVGAIQKLSQDGVTQLDQPQVRTRAFEALRGILCRLANERRVVMFADDLQWGDADSAEVMGDILRGPNAPAVFFIGSNRSEEADASPFLARWNESADELGIASHQIVVSQLTVEECVYLTVTLVGEDTEVVRRRAFEFAQQTGGNPFLLTELISCFDPHADSFRVMPIYEVIESKLERLPSEAASILHAIAVSGQSSHLEEVARAVGHEQTAHSIVTHMRSEKLVRLIGDDISSSVDTYHDKIRETVLSRMPDEHRKRLHGSLGASIEQSCGGINGDDLQQSLYGDKPPGAALLERVYDLSYHFDLAECQEKAYTYAMLAADQASRQFSQRVAADQYAIARRNKPAGDHEAEFRIARGEGRALSLLGEYEEAAKTLKGADALTSEPFQQAQIFGLLGEISHKQGKVRAGISSYTLALRRLGHFVPGSVPSVFLALLYETFIQVLHTVLPSRAYQRDAALSDEQELAVELANRKSMVSYSDNSLRMLWSHLKGFNLAETRRPSLGLAYAYGLHPAPISAFGMHRRGTKYSDIAIDTAKRFEDLLTQGHCYGFRSMALHGGAEHQAAVQSGRKSLELLERAGDSYLMFMAESHVALSSHRLTDVRTAIEVASGGFERSIRLGEDMSARGLLYAWSVATNGNLPFEELRSCFTDDPEDKFSTALVAMGEGIWHLHHERFDSAVESFRLACDVSRRNFIISPYTVSGAIWLVTAKRLQADAIKSNVERERRLRKLCRFAKWANLLSRLYPSTQPHARRELGRIFCAIGKQRRGLAQIQLSIKLAEQHGDQWEKTLSQIARGCIEEELGEPGRSEQTIEAVEFLARVQEEIMAEMSDRISPQEFHAADRPESQPRAEGHAKLARTRIEDGVHNKH
jgi:serine/threonine protein kinase/tetratricopeptide (TPR) repeat protein